MPPRNSQAAERIGYPTQNPLPLRERISKASSDPDDLVLDAFGGCGTALVAAEKLGRRWIGIDSSPTACRVMAERLKKVCGPQEGKLFARRDLPRPEAHRRALPFFAFQNGAVIALGGIPNKTKTGDRGIDGRLCPVGVVSKQKAEQTGEFDFMDAWYPVQVKQLDKAGRPGSDSFEAAVMRAKRPKGDFVAFDCTGGALKESRRFFKATGISSAAFTVPSQSTGNKYRVTLGEPLACQGQDWQLRQPPCKHLRAARRVCARDHGGKAPESAAAAVPLRPTCKQDGPLSDHAQRTENGVEQVALGALV